MGGPGQPRSSVVAKGQARLFDEDESMTFEMASSPALILALAAGIICQIICVPTKELLFLR